MKILEVRNLSKNFGGIQAVSDVTFDLNEGEILGLMGANGAGKTTLMSMLAGNVQPSSGSIALDGTRIERLPAHKVSQLGIARTFQIVRPFAGMTVLENVRLGCLYGKSQMRSMAMATDAATEILAEVGLEARAGTKAGALNLAGRKRLEVARALATSPRVLLLDEVLAGLNASEANDALAMIQKLRGSRGLSIIIIEHVMKALMRLSNRIVVLHDGQKITEGTPDAVTSDPRVIAAYLGEGRHVHPA
jgi:branched-chain amino acid transport system ATP-binding protein